MKSKLNKMFIDSTYKLLRQNGMKKNAISFNWKPYLVHKLQEHKKK
jgi:hypothetical protein